MLLEEDVEGRVWLLGEKLSLADKSTEPFMPLSLVQPGMPMSRPSCQLTTGAKAEPVSQVITPLRCAAILPQTRWRHGDGSRCQVQSLLQQNQFPTAVPPVGGDCLPLWSWLSVSAILLGPEELESKELALILNAPPLPGSLSVNGSHRNAEGW